MFSKNTINEIYKYISVIFFSICILFFGINIAAHLILNSNFIVEKHARFYLENIIQEDAYYDSNNIVSLDNNYINDILKDNTLYSLQKGGDYTYYPIVEFLKSIFTSENINIIQPDNDVPQRLVKRNFDKNRDDFDKSIYCFGGSTTFGDLVADHHTWPAFLEEILNEKNIEVRNYGCQAFSPNQETLLFLSLLSLGHRPSLCIFLDGINTGPIFQGSEFSKDIAHRVYFNNDFKSILIETLFSLPIMKLVIHYKRKSIYTNSRDFDLTPLEFGTENQYLIYNRFMENAKLRELISKEYNVPIIQFLQPNSMMYYKYELLTGLPKKLYLEDENFININNNYRALYDSLVVNNSGFIDISNLFELYPRHAVVDGLHYSPDFNFYLAKDILKYFDVDTLPIYMIDKGGSSAKSFNTNTF